MIGAVGLGSDAAGEGLWDRLRVPQAFFHARMPALKDSWRKGCSNDVIYPENTG